MRTRRLLEGAVIGAIYAVLTIVLAPISYGPVQVRVSEILTILPRFTPAAIPGLFVGCLVANMVGPYGIVDIVCGSLASLISAFLSYKLKAHSWLVPLPPVIINGIMVGGMLHYVYNVPGLLLCMGWVALGQAVACYGGGIPLGKILEKYKGVFK